MNLSELYDFLLSNINHVAVIILFLIGGCISAICFGDDFLDFSLEPHDYITEEDAAELEKLILELEEKALLEKEQDREN